MNRGLNVKFLAGLVAAGLFSTPAHAIHRRTPGVTLITPSSEYTLPRLPSLGNTLLISAGPHGARNIFKIRVRDLDQGLSPEPLSDGGDNTNPVGGRGARLFAWDSTDSPFPSEHGHQIGLRSSIATFPEFFNDPTGTSASPSVSYLAGAIAWESRGNLAGINPAASSQIFFVHHRDTGVRQLSRGAGNSRNAAMGGNNSLVAFDSTSDPVTGEDTHVPQIWLADVENGEASPFTDGKGGSEFPSMSQDSHIIVFQSTAALDDDGHDTGIPQVFARDTYGGTFARVTSDPAGCTLPSVRNAKGDFRVAYTCGGNAFISELRSGLQYVLPTPGGHTARVVSELGNFFVVISTTANLLGTGVTPEHRLYLWNLYKRPALSVPSSLKWFPAKTQSQP